MKDHLWQPCEATHYIVINELSYYNQVVKCSAQN